MTGRKNEGFTLVELMVTIVAASIVTLAATTVLLLGMRINAQSSGVITRQNTARVFMTALENMAAEGVIVEAKETATGWEVTHESAQQGEEPALSYHKEQGAEAGTILAKGTALVEDVLHSTIVMEDSGLLTCTLKTRDGDYEMSVYCRTVDTAKTEARNAARNVFLQTLVSQLYQTGEVLNDGKIAGTEQYYYQWYLGNPGYEDDVWNASTPWCALYVSWSLVQSGQSGPGGSKWFADVDQFVDYLKTGNEEGHRWKATSPESPYLPEPGDLIFFNIDGNGDTDGADDTDHMGVVISVAGGFVYTIEGNVDDFVRLQKHELDNGTIQGYGVLNWN